MGVVFWFLDGLGLAPAGPDNPLAQARMPTIRRLLGGPLVQGARPAQGSVLLRSIDATLGVDGLPQSGTGQTTLLTGVNAAREHGRHQPAFPPVALRPVLETGSLFSQVLATGRRVAFANLFTSGYWQLISRRPGRAAASVLAAQGAGVRFRTLDDLAAGAAVPWDLTGAFLRGHVPQMRECTPEQSGEVLARLGAWYDFTYFECYLPDLAAHGRTGVSLDQALQQIDRALAAVLAHMAPDTTLVLTSDHGNCESIAAPAHTRNPVPLLAIGPQAGAFADVGDLTGVAPAILRAVAGATGKQRTHG